MRVIVLVLLPTYNSPTFVTVENPVPPFNGVTVPLKYVVVSMLTTPAVTLTNPVDPVNEPSVNAPFNVMVGVVPAVVPMTMVVMPPVVPLVPMLIALVPDAAADVPILIVPVVIPSPTVMVPATMLGNTFANLPAASAALSSVTPPSVFELILRMLTTVVVVPPMVAVTAAVALVPRLSDVATPNALTVVATVFHKF